MTPVDIVIIVLCVLAVIGVATAAVIRKKTGKGHSCGDCASCTACKHAGESAATDKPAAPSEAVTPVTHGCDCASCSAGGCPHRSAAEQKVGAAKDRQTPAAAANRISLFSANNAAPLRCLSFPGAFRSYLPHPANRVAQKISRRRRLRLIFSRCRAYSHSMVAGGLAVMSYTTRLTPLTSLTMREEAARSTE